MDYIVREFTINDAEFIYKLNLEEMGYKYPLEETRNKLYQLINSDKDKIYVAETDKKVVGYIHANDYDVIYAPHMKNIMGVAVLKEYKKQGIGKALLAKVEEWAKETGASGIRLVSGSKRMDAHSFYRNCGYGNDKQQLNFTKVF